MKYLIVFSGLLVIVILLSHVSRAQSSGRTGEKNPSIKQNNIEVINQGTIVYSGTKDEIECILESGYPKVAKRFAELFPGAANQLWIKEDNTLFVYFLNKDIKMSAVFTIRGSMNYSIARLDVSDIPEIMKQRIKKSYVLYSIFNVKEITAQEHTVYEIVLENTSGYIVIQINENEIVETEKVRKVDSR